MNVALKDEYRTFLETKALNNDLWALVGRLSSQNQRAAIDNLVDRVVQQNGDGRGDKEFMVWMDIPDYAV